MTPGLDSIQVRFQLAWFCFVFASALVRPALECMSGALRWSSRCLPLAPLASRMVTWTASKTPHVMNIFELVPVSVYVAAARRTAAWHTPTVPKFLRHLPLTVRVRVNVSATGCRIDTTTFNPVQVHFTQICFINTRHGAAACCVCAHAAFACDNRAGLGTGPMLGVCVDGSGSSGHQSFCASCRPTTLGIYYCS